MSIPVRRWMIVLMVVGVLSALLPSCGKSNPPGAPPGEGPSKPPPTTAPPPITAPSRPLEADVAGYGVIDRADGGSAELRGAARRSE